MGAILVLIAAVLLLFLIAYWWVILLIALFVAVVAVIAFALHLKHVDNVVEAEIIEEVPITKVVSEKVGHTTSYGRGLSYHEHYRDREVVTGYNVRFAVKYKNGSRGVIICKKGGVAYNKLMGMHPTTA